MKHILLLILIILTKAVFSQKTKSESVKIEYLKARKIEIKSISLKTDTLIYEVPYYFLGPFRCLTGVYEEEKKWSKRHYTQLADLLRFF